MPLSPAEHAELSLRATGANFLDPRAPRLDERGRSELESRLNGIRDAAARASIEVRDHASFVAFLGGVRQELETSLTVRNETLEVSIAVKKVIQTLSDVVGHVQEGHDGDGPARDAYPGGINPIAFAVQNNVIRAYTVAGATLLAGPPIYKTYITPDIPQKLGSFNVGGQTCIDTSPSVVTILIRKKAHLTARDLWQLAYVLHHELVCHGFQSAGQQVHRGRKNAAAGCHWTEGWMDAVAFTLSTLWASREDCKSCFSFGGSTAINDMNEMHQARYPNPNATDPLRRRPPDISEDDAYMRLSARQAFDALSANLALVGDPRDADDMASKFSLRLNAHKDVDLAILRRLSTRLQSTLFNAIRPQVARDAAIACVEFAATGNLVDLERDLALAEEAP